MSSSMSPFLDFHVSQMLVEVVETALPLAAKRLHPGIDASESNARQRPWPALGIAPPFNEAGLFQHPQMLRYRRLTEAERPHQLRHIRTTQRQPSQDGAPGRIGERRECMIERFPIQCHSSIFPCGY